MRIPAFILAFCFAVLSVSAQKKTLDHSDYDLWNTIKNQSISNNGDHVLYALERGEKDQFLKLKTTDGKILLEHDRTSKGQFTYDSKFAVFSIKAWKDSIVELKRRKVKKNKMPKDTLAIFDIKNTKLTKIPNVKSYKLPQKWSGYVAYFYEDVPKKKSKKKEVKSKEKGEKSKEKEKEKEKKKSKKKAKTKKVGKKNGYHLVLRNLATQKEDTIKYVKSFVFAEEGKRLAYITTGTNKAKKGGIYVLNLENNTTSEVFTSNPKSKYYRLTMSEDGSQLGFVVDQDTTKALVRPYELYSWKSGAANATKVLDASSAPKGYGVSKNGRLSFSKDNSKLFFGLATPPIVKDTTLLKEEIVNVEVWSYDSPRLYTVQELQVNNDKSKSYTAVVHLDNNKVVQLGSTKNPNTTIGNEGNAKYALVANPTPYMLESQWTAIRSSDYSLVDVNTGESKQILTEFSGRANFSPLGNYVYGYDRVDSTWVSYDIANDKIVKLTKGKVFYNEIHDTPSHPYPYGSAGWTKDDASLLLYDRYDIVEFNPSTGASKRLTNGREDKITYRYLSLDREERFLDPNSKWLLSIFNEVNKDGGYYSYDAKRNKGKLLLEGPYLYSRRPLKAKEKNTLVYTRESFKEFPNLITTDLSFKKSKVISNANPQQKDYNWGSIELVHWTSSEGKALSGMLVKPENFDPNKKYPMLVNFYEKSSNGIHRHRVPRAERSSINYSFYTSRGYVIFNPDIVYRDGYPGESAYNAVISGVTHVLGMGFVDKKRIGAQGHSWGGYQVAHLATKTDIFAAIESGAPVVNMISAYGGIRWWTGLSRQFQYEHTQSRIGGTPWQYPMRYIENSPIFNIDKINTPLLIMHNDADGHVPWYQGIEFFVSLRRLGKPSWFLNYNNEPHWPLKMQNRKDFNIRMAQFFDYYLKGDPKPVWMVRGVPAIEKGINQGYEYIKKD